PKGCPPRHDDHLAAVPHVLRRGCRDPRSDRAPRRRMQRQRRFIDLEDEVLVRRRRARQAHARRPRRRPDRVHHTDRRSRAVRHRAGGTRTGDARRCPRPAARARHHRSGGQRRRARPPRHRVLARRLEAVPLLHEPGRRHPRRRIPDVRECGGHRLTPPAPRGGPSGGAEPQRRAVGLRTRPATVNRARAAPGARGRGRAPRAGAGRPVAQGEGGTARRRDRRWGKPRRTARTRSGGAPSSTPPDTPFAGGGGMPEIWAYGLRNPWRFSWDRETADMWIADVGQNQWEEIDFVRAGRGAGANYGWNQVEGNHEFSGAAPAGAVGPIHEYSHAGGGCSISGGYVYRGSKIPGLTGQYLFSDYCDSTIRSIRERGGKVADQRDLGLKANQVTAFGQDQDGQLYVLSQGDGVQRVDPA